MSETTMRKVLRSVPSAAFRDAFLLNPASSSPKKTQRISNKGYASVTLSKHGQSNTHHVHRLLALAFIPNLDNKPIINHRNGNKLDNAIENLEWVTYSENAIHAYQTSLYKSNERKRRLILDACTGETYTSIKKAAVHLNINYATCRNYLSGHSPNRTCLQYAA